MDQPQDTKTQTGLNRRTFIGALGAAAIAAVGAPGKAAAQGPPPPPPQTTFMNSFGQIQPVAADTLAAGVIPPPLLPQIPTNNSTPQAHRPTRRFGILSRKQRVRPEVLGTGGGGCQSASCLVTHTTLSPNYPKYNMLMIIVD